jgi:pentatricopeptide repeat protein
MSGKNVVSWSTMIAGYTQNGHALEALELFSQMQEASVKPNSVTITSVLPACAQLGDLQRGKWIHDFAVRNGFESDISVRNSLVAMYAKCGSVENARQVFDKMSIRDVVSWSAMIAGYAQNGNDHEALVLFNQMQQAGVKPNSVTLLSVLSACAKLGALQQGKWVQDYVAENGMQFNISVQNSLVDMYAKCGEMEIACKVFEQISIRDVVSWNALISGYAQNGYASETLTLFHQMQLAGMMPDSVTMVSVLLACAHLGTLQQGKLIHDYVIKSGV